MSTPATLTADELPGLANAADHDWLQLPVLQDRCRKLVDRIRVKGPPGIVRVGLDLLYPQDQPSTVPRLLDLLPSLLAGGLPHESPGTWPKRPGHYAETRAMAAWCWPTISRIASTTGW